jgi:hypothetical protein
MAKPTSRISIHLAPFDRNSEFVANREFLCRGRHYQRGEIFDKSSVAIRTLRILYEGRSLSVAPQVQAEDPKPKSAVMTADERAELIASNTKPDLIKMLTNLKVAIDPRWNKPALADEIARARNVLACI